MAREYTPDELDAAYKFAQTMRKERNRLRMSQTALAEKMGVARPTVSKHESGNHIPPMDFVMRADDALGLNGTLVKLLPSPKGRRHKHLTRYVHIEQEKAVALQQWQAQVVPALLQTQEYSRAVAAATVPPKSAEEVDKITAVRLERQKAFTREHPLTAHFVLDEGAVRRLVGGRALMKEQWDHLIRCMDHRHITVQVLLHSHGAHAALLGSYTILEVSSRESALYMETMTSGTVETDGEHVMHARQRFAALMARALSPEDTAQFLEEMKGAA